MKKNIYKGAPNCLRKLRKINGYTQKEVAMVLGIKNTGMISRWESGQRFPNAMNMFRLAILYRTMADALYIDQIRILRDEIKKKREKLQA